MERSSLVNHALNALLVANIDLYRFNVAGQTYLTARGCRILCVIEVKVGADQSCCTTSSQSLGYCTANATTYDGLALYLQDRVC